MNTKLLNSISALSMLAGFACAAPALAGEGMADADRATVMSIDVPIAPSFSYANTAHVANGVALRNRVSGFIHSRGVPTGSGRVKAYLYWNYSDGLATGPGSAAALFDGNRVSGTKVADNPDPCWGLTGNHTYRADVSAFVPSSRTNEDYEVMIYGPKSTTGQNPWTPEPQDVRAEGATLVIVHTASSGSTVNIYDALTGGGFSGSATFTLTHPPFSGSGLFTIVGADGQRGGGHDNFASNETGFFNGSQISGPPVAASDWDGSAGWPLPQLWDVHTHIVSLSETAASVAYTAGADCLVPVAFVIQQGT